MIDSRQVRLGRRPPRFDKRTLRLEHYLTADFKAPVRRDWSPKVTTLGPMLNLNLSCCTVSAKGHLIQAWTANHDRQEIVTDNAIMQGYMEACGYVPGDPATDQGGIMLDVLNWFRKTGLAGHRPLAFVAVNHHNKEHVRLSVDLFGGCDVGIMLPISAQNQEVWSVPEGGPVGDGAPGSWGGHDIPIVGYGLLGPTCITWGRLVTMTWEFFKTYAEEAYAILSEDWASGAKVAPNGFSLEQLKADLSTITA